MESLVNICLVLALLIVRVISLQEGLKVNIKPKKERFFFEVGKKPEETIACESDCQESSDCKYTWYLYDNGKFEKIVTKGKILSLNKTVEEKNDTFKCEVRNSQFFGRSKAITVIFQVPKNRPLASSPHTVSVIQSSANVVSSHSTTAPKYVENDASFISVQSVIIISICAAAAVLLITIVVLVGFLCVKTKQKQNKRCNESRRNTTTQEKDRELGLTENTLYITADNVTKMPSSNPTQNNTPTTESGNDVYAVVNKPRKTENHNPVYAEVNNSQAEKGNPATTKKPSGKEENKPGQNVNKDGMVYVEIDFKDFPANGKSTMQGVENKTLYVDIDSIKQTETQPSSGEKESPELQQNEKESHAE